MTYFSPHFVSKFTIRKYFFLSYYICKFIQRKSYLLPYFICIFIQKAILFLILLHTQVHPKNILFLTLFHTTEPSFISFIRPSDTPSLSLPNVMCKFIKRKEKKILSLSPSRDDGTQFLSLSFTPLTHTLYHDLSLAQNVACLLQAVVPLSWDVCGRGVDLLQAFPLSSYYTICDLFMLS